MREPAICATIDWQRRVIIIIIITIIVIIIIVCVCVRVRVRVFACACVCARACVCACLKYIVCSVVCGVLNQFVLLLLLGLR